ncbi:hypothetical protein K461DRAFT_291525 [Myriangium duriaei CBS 260.36]|uniref:Uncharacterized protein n=1 Tax=Myriangium duriaei CBS 260.36 TaxID=1168546 RepID=A0A9P4J4D7_9PEZI|nr:hypothetical protein K461DRAFT_291525 [Myriangium duriaei CBS 260.36]
MSSETLDHTSVAQFIRRHGLDQYVVNYDGQARTWGFILVRTTSSSTWDTAIMKVKENLRFALATTRSMEGSTNTFAEDLVMSRLRFVILDDEELQDADDQHIREYCQTWRETFVDTAPGCIPTNVCLALETSSLESIANCPNATVDSDTGRLTQIDDFKIYLRVIDIEYELDEEWDAYGPCYRGWSRTTAKYLPDLWQDVQIRDFDIFAPKLEFHGQIPVYDGSLHGHLIDPPGGTSGRLRLSGEDLPDTIWGDVRRVEREERERI